ncbi:MAG: cell division protein FtsZ, partial [Rhodobacteraceae bacterium]
DDVLYQGVKGVTDLMVRPGLINLDFADVRAVMDEMGKAMMGTGEAEGENRAVDAAEKAIANPLLDEVSLRGARGVLINITGGYDLTLFELDEAANRIRAEVDPDANIIVGSTLDPDMANVMRVSVVATGIDAGASAARPDLDDAGSAQAVAGRSAALRPGAAARDAAADARGAARVEAVRPAVARVEPTQPETAAEAQRSETARAEPATSDAAPAAAEANLFASQDPTAGFDLDFDLDDGSLARRPPPTRPEPARDHPFVVAERAASEPSPRPAVGAARPPARAAARAEPVEERGARFGFNNLIHRMTGSSREKEQEHPFSTAAMQQRREPPAPAPRDLIDDDDARMEIPAFLRRQAN